MKFSVFSFKFCIFVGTFSALNFDKNEIYTFCNKNAYIYIISIKYISYFPDSQTLCSPKCPKAFPENLWGWWTHKQCRWKEPKWKPTSRAHQIIHLYWKKFMVIKYGKVIERSFLITYILLIVSIVNLLIVKKDPVVADLLYIAIQSSSSIQVKIYYSYQSVV